VAERCTLPTSGEGHAFHRSPHPPTSREIDELWDRLSHAYALVHCESRAEMIQEEMEALRAMLEERRSSQLKKSA